VRGKAEGPPGWAVCDLERPEQFAAALDQGWTRLGRVDAVVVTAGLFGTQDQLAQDRELLARMLRVNYVHTILFCEEARQRLLAQGGGTLCVFSSVAGDRGRKPIALYGSSKAGLSHYLESLDHRHHAEGLRVVCVKPGFVRTGMTEGLKAPPFAGEPEEVAQIAMAALDRGSPVVYAPGIWALVMVVIRHLPRAVMRRVGF
jgi:NAD(P)-dependent dehydrogenase (short-subunit alcohol dehydrogenase family)